MSLPFKFTTASALRRPLLPSTLSHPPSYILLRNRHSKADATARLARRGVKDGVARSEAQQPLSEDATIANQQQKSMEYALSQGMNPLIPTTFVALPLTQLPSSPKDKLAYLWYRFRGWLNSVALIFGTKLDSMMNWKTRPQFKARLSKIPPTAKIMYRELLEAFAAGDKETIKKVCTPHLASQYNNAIDKRSRGIGVRWELVKYNGSPKLKSYMIIPMNSKNNESLTEQAVVAISSTQRSSKWNTALNHSVPGSERERDGVEYVVLKREYSKALWRPTTDWQIWGTTEPTTLKAIRDDMEMIKQRQIEMAGWKVTNSKEKKKTA